MNEFPGTWISRFADTFTRGGGDTTLGANWDIVSGQYYVSGTVQGQVDATGIATIATAAYTFSANQAVEAVVSLPQDGGYAVFDLVLSRTATGYYYARVAFSSTNQYTFGIGRVPSNTAFKTELVTAPFTIIGPTLRMRFCRVDNVFLIYDMDNGVVVAGAADASNIILPLGQPGIQYNLNVSGVPELDNVEAFDYQADTIPSGGGGGGTGIYPTFEVQHQTQVGCNLAGASSRTGASYTAVFVKYDMPTYGNVLFASSGANPFVAYCNADGSMQIDADGTTLTASTLTADLDWGAQFGVLYWHDGVHNFQYVVNGKTSNTVTYNGTLGVNVFRAGYDAGVTPQYPVNFDEFLFWQAGNQLTDDDLFDIYKSYYASEGFIVSSFGKGIIQTGFWNTAFGCGNFVAAVYKDITSCLIVDSLCHHLDFVSSRPCLYFDSIRPCLEFDSADLSPFNSKHHCTTHSTTGD